MMAEKKKRTGAGRKTSAFGDRRKRKSRAQEPAKTKNTQGEARGAGIRCAKCA